MYQQREVAAMLMAAGSSTRMGFDKLFYLIDGVEVFRLSLSRLDSHPYVDRHIIVAGENIDKIKSVLQCHPPVKPYVVVPGGASRAESVGAGLRESEGAGLLAIHDAARPYVSKKVISRTIEAAAKVGAAAPAVPVKDTIKQAENCMVQSTVPRSSVQAVQTPQVFDRDAYARAFASVAPAVYEKITDDCLVMERAGHPVRLVPGEAGNIKITTEEDLPIKAAGPCPMPRMGHGYDVHRLVEGRPLILGGVEVPFEKGLLGHSDADVLCHAVADALLGAAALGDIGQHFPDTDPAYEGADSIELLKATAGVLRASGFTPVNVDATVLCQAPKLMPYIQAMRRRLAKALDIEESRVSVKATTEEGLGFTGGGEGIAAHSVAVIRSI